MIFNFDEVYKNERWTKEGNGSGPGSTIEYTQPIIKFITQLIITYKIQHITDISCGGMAWWPSILDNFPTISFYGYDVASVIIDENIKKFKDYPNYHFDTIDSVNNKFYPADLIVCRHTMMHISIENCQKLLDNMINSRSKYLLLTSHPHVLENIDCCTKLLPNTDNCFIFKFMNLEKSPFYMVPIEHVKETGNHSEILGLYCNPVFDVIDKYIPARCETSIIQKIPRKIYQTHETNYLPKRMIEKGCNTWIDLNPEYEYYFFDQNDREIFIGTHFRENILFAYKSLNHGCIQADIFRLCLMYELGGIYSDIDQVCLKPLNEYIDNDCDIVTGIEQNTPHSSFLAYSPKNPIMQLALEQSVNRILTNNPLKGPWAGFQSGYAGPVAFDYAWKYYHNRYEAQKMIDENNNYNWNLIYLKESKYILNKLCFKLMPSLFQNGRINVKYDGYHEDNTLMDIKYWTSCIDLINQNIDKYQSKTCLISCIFGKSFDRVYQAPNGYDSYFFTNNSFLENEITKKGWIYKNIDIEITDNLVISSNQSKYIKFLQILKESKHKYLLSYDQIIYIDHKFQIEKSHIEKLLQLKQKPILIRTTPRIKLKIQDEINDAHNQIRYQQFEDKTIEYIQQKITDGYTDTIRICNTGLIIYNGAVEKLF
jgi:hypothetical protein